MKKVEFGKLRVEIYLVISRKCNLKIVILPYDML